MDDRHIILVGLPGAGKSTIGLFLAEKLERSFCDFDEEIARIFGKSVSNIFTEDGESAFRKAEAELSERWIGRPPAVLAPGGGWVANQEAMAHLRPLARIIYLRVTPAEALRRMGGGVTKRPMFAHSDPGEVMQQLYDARRDHYEAVADVVIETDGLALSELSATVVGTVTIMLDLKHENDERRI